MRSTGISSRLLSGRLLGRSAAIHQRQTGHLDKPFAAPPRVWPLNYRAIGSPEIHYRRISDRRCLSNRRLDRARCSVPQIGEITGFVWPQLLAADDAFGSLLDEHALLEWNLLFASAPVRNYRRSNLQNAGELLCPPPLLACPLVELHAPIISHWLIKCQ